MNEELNITEMINEQYAKFIKMGVSSMMAKAATAKAFMTWIEQYDHSEADRRKMAQLLTRWVTGQTL